MDPRIGFTAYTDVPSAIIVAITVLIVSDGVGAARRGASEVATGWFAWAGLLSLTLILLRTTNLVLVGAIDAGGGLLLVLFAAGSPRLWTRWALLLIVPAAVGELAWEAHLWAARIAPDISPRPLCLWDWSAPVTVARAFVLDRLAGNPLGGGAALGFVVLAIVGGVMVWRRLDGDDDGNLPPPRVALSLTAIVGVCFVGFLAWTYVAVFSREEVAAAASLWRYLSELGPMLVSTGSCVALGLLAERHWNAPAAFAAAGLGVCLLMLLPFAGRDYYRLDCRLPDVAAARAAIAELRPALEPLGAPALNPSRVAVVNPTMGDWMAYAMAFDLRWPASGQFVHFRVKNEPLADTEIWAWDHGFDALLDFTPLDRAALRARARIPAVSLLGRPAAKGDKWLILATTRPRPLPSCSTWGN